jgi:DnaJ domain
VERIQDRSQENPALTYYDDLGLPATASDEEIREAYLHLVRLLHPDLQREKSLKRFADYQMKRVSRAYSVLSDPARRERYDAELARRGETEVVAPASGRSGGRSRARAWITLGWLICACAGAIGIGWYMSEPSGAPLREVRAAPDTHALGAVVPASTAQPAATPAAANNATPTSTEPGATASGSAEPNPAESKPLDPTPAAVNPAPAASSPPPADSVELESLRSELAAAKTERDRARAYIALQHKQLDFLADRILAGPPKVPKGFAGVWVLPRASSFSANASYAPTTADLIVIESAGAIQGRYRARYPAMGRPEPTMLRFYFEGKSESDVANLSWKGDSGAKGDVQLRLVSNYSLELVWSATEIGKESGPGSGTMLLMRRREP